MVTHYNNINNNNRTYIALLYRLSMISKHFTELLIIIPVSQQLSCPTSTHLLLGEQGEFFNRGPEPGIEPATFLTAVRRFTHETTASPFKSPLMQSCQFPK